MGRGHSNIPSQALLFRSDGCSLPADSYHRHPLASPPRNASMERAYQYGFSTVHANTVFNEHERRRKGLKILAVLEDHFGASLGRVRALDVGCSTGLVTSTVAERLGETIGVDIDEPAIRHAQSAFGSPRLHFHVRSATDLGFPDESFDAVICAHVYEHVPDAKKMMAEIHRVLRPGAVCFFAAGNRIRLMEPHYHLPLLSVVPKPVADLYLRAVRRGDHYYETHLTLVGLRRLVHQFEVLDYTRRILADPRRFRADDMLSPGSLKLALARAACRVAPLLFPTFIWLLRKGCSSPHSQEPTRCPASASS